MNFKLNNFTELVASTPNNFDHTVGYHDIRPFNQFNDNLLVLHRYPLNNLGFLADKVNTDICLWDYHNSKIDKIDTTGAWSWEQGSRLQWLNEKEIIYNKIDDGKLVSCIYNIQEEKKKNLINPIYSISKKTKKFLTVNYSRIWNLWKSYGYHVNNEKIDYEESPKDDGVFLCDFDNNKKLVLSIREAVELCGLQNIKNTSFFLSLPTFSPEGDKFVSHLRFHLKSGAVASYFICTYINEPRNQLLAGEKVSHLEWINNEKIVVWSRNLPLYFQKLRLNTFLEKYFVTNLKKVVNKFRPTLKTRIKSEHYHLIDLKRPNKITKLDEKILTEDGHPQISEDGKYLIMDTYPNKAGYQKLMLYDLEKNKTHDVGEFRISENLTNNDLKCDLHPRWNHKGNLISIDSSHEGSRQSYIINVEKLINNIN